MANTNETITDIIKGIRAEANYIEENARGSLKAGENYDGIAFTESDLESALDLADTKRKEADRLEAALKRECGDCARTLGFTPKDKVAGVWMDECGVCHLCKPCTDLYHDWNPPKRGVAK